jgi:4-amino-4-deoxy-L-arabinose transferase-like glycosyltransferase
VIVLVIAATSTLYFANLQRNPPGYYIDESSISYNAYTISQTGHDEFGNSWPLYFRAFGDYKNPVYIYLLAAIYRITGPGVLPARMLSATLGVLAAVSLGLLAWRMTKKKFVAMLVSLMALLTPWLFEMSRVVLEVALYPLVLALFLNCVYVASTRAQWMWRDVLCIATMLALLTYTYSIGRLLGPLLAVGLVFFASRERRSGVSLTWAIYVLLILPLLLFNWRHPGALSGRFYLITYIEPRSTYPQILWEFTRHFFANFNPWRLFINGDPNPEQIAHIYGTPLLPAATGILTLAGLYLILKFHRHQPLWRFLIYCVAVSVVPASLTKEYVHMLRLAPLLIFLTVLTIPALEWVFADWRKHRAALVFIVVLTVLQGAIFQWQFHVTAGSQTRLRQFDSRYPDTIFGRAVARPERPIYLADALAIPGYIQAYWNATLRGVPLSNFSRLAPEALAPPGSLVISTEERCLRCEIIATSYFYKLYVVTGQAPERTPLPGADFRARLSVVSAPSVVRAGEQFSVHVSVKNDGNTVWLAQERSGSPLQVSLGDHWLDSEGRMVIPDDGRSPVLDDIKPGQEVHLSLTVNAPKTAGDFVLELDMVQEGVSWFGLRGSPTLRLPVKIERSWWR